MPVGVHGTWTAARRTSAPPIEDTIGATRASPVSIAADDVVLTAEQLERLKMIERQHSARLK
jgi:hypothetical protein